MNNEVFDSSFSKTKVFSDFVGFHVRAVFCLTLAFIAIIPSVDDWFIELETIGQVTMQRSGIEYLVQIGACSLFLLFYAILMFRIFTTIILFFGAWGNNGPLQFILGLFALLGTIALELCAFVVIGYFVFLRLFSFVFIDFTENDKYQIRMCLLDEFVHEKSISPAAPREGCAEMLLEYRNIQGVTHG